MDGFAMPPGMPLPRVRWYNTEDQRDATFADSAPRVPWGVFLRDYFHPAPGEHVTIIGSTGKGKSELMNHILPHYPFTVMFGTKPVDRTLDRLRTEHGYIVLEKWRALPSRDYPRRIIWPKSGNLKTVTDTQRAVFEDAIEKIYAEGGRPANAPVGWAIGIDEIWYFVHMLGMEKYLRLILQHARSLGISLLAATQRGAFIPTEFYSQPTHLFYFLTRDENNLKRIGDLQAGNRQVIRALVSNLDQYQVLYVNNVTGQMARTRTPAPKEG